MRISKNERINEAAYIALLILPFFIFFAITISQFNQVPSPLYGGDYYMHYGIANHIYNGNAPWTDPQIQGEYNFYGWLYHSAVAYTAKITGISLLKVFLFFPLVALILSGITSFYLGKKFFKKDYWAFLTGFIWVGVMTNYNITHARPFATTFLVPLFLLTFLNLKENQKTSNKIYLGLTLGALGLTHLMAFTSAGLFLIVYCLYELIISLKQKSRIKSLGGEIKNLFSTFAISIIIAILIALPYIGPLVFHYKLQALNNQPVYSSPIPGFLNIYGFAKTMFFNYSGIMPFIISIISLIGAYYVITNLEKFENKIIFVFFITTIVAGFYWIITMPLGINLMVYWQLMDYLMPILTLLFLATGIIAIYNSVKPQIFKYASIAAIVLILMTQAYTVKAVSYNDRWTNVGRQSNDLMQNIESWVKQNTDKNAVFLSTNEGSFAIFSITGRKLVVNRGTHASQFVDFDKRMTEASIILYGNNTEKRKELIKKYNISYVYYDSNWVSSLEWDPFLVFPKNQGLLEDYNVSYHKVHRRLDPAKTDVPEYDLLEIKNNEIWNPDFYSMMYPVMVWGDPKQPAVVIFAINKTMVD